METKIFLGAVEDVSGAEDEEAEGSIARSPAEAGGAAVSLETVEGLVIWADDWSAGVLAGVLLESGSEADSEGNAADISPGSLVVGWMDFLAFVCDSVEADEPCSWGGAVEGLLETTEGRPRLWEVSGGLSMTEAVGVDGISFFRSI